MKNPVNFLSHPKFILLIFLFYSCVLSSNKTQLAGLYVSKQLSSFDSIALKLKGEGHEVGGELELKSDSTYIKKSCGNDIHGHWKVEGDSLVLFCEKNLHFKRGNTEPENWSCGTAPEKFFIEKSGELIQYSIDENRRNHHRFEKKKLN
ncbi:MAG: hypothetical protein IT236_01805 [Bacteroidia bacterium]|nr:hypothetical protein [Bacteroidia bacterium]